jgi:hypothetical protein
MAFTIVTQGTFTQPATAINQVIPLPSGADYFKTYNLTQMPLTPATAVVVMGEWFGGGLTANNDGLRWKKSNSTNALVLDTFQTATASNGFTYVNAPPQPEAALTGTYSEGDVVTIYNSVGAQMYSGMSFTISSVSGSGFTLLGLNSPGSAATSFQVRRVSKLMPVEPRYLYVTGITQATQAVVTVSEQHQYVVGQNVEFSIPGSFGMVQLNNFNQPQSKPPLITAVTAYTFTINVNTTNYTAFAFPATALSPTTQLFATVSSAGQNVNYNPITGVQMGYNVNYVPFHSGILIPYMYIPSGAQSPGGAAGDTILWQNWKAETGTINSPVPS